jgi:tight adherence protein B
MFGRDGRRRLRSIAGPSTAGSSTAKSTASSRRSALESAANADTVGGALAKLIWRRPRLAATVIVGTAAATAAAFGGPVAAVIAATYVATGAVVVAARRRTAADAKAFARALAAVGAVAADLRAGGDPQTSLARVQPVLRHPAASSMSRRVDAALRVADDTGAPLAELLDRLETDGRTLARARASATAQASGAQATAWLLAALPAAGIALGTGVGADPVHVLLRTPLGAACAGGAMSFQIVGLVWTQRLANSIKDAA